MSTRFDDRDPSVTYTGDWLNIDDETGCFNRTLSAAITPGSTAVFEVEITSEGPWVTAFGSFFPFSGSPSVVDIFIDGGDLGGSATQNVSKQENGQLLFQTWPLSGGTHQIVVNVTSCSKEAPYYIDYFEVDSPGAIVSSAITSASATSAKVSSDTPVTSAKLSSTSAASQTSSLSSAASSSSSSVATAGAAVNSSSSSTPVGAIIGGVIGGIAVIAAAVVILAYFYWKRNKGQGFFFNSTGAGLLDHEAKDSSNESPYIVTAQATPPPPSASPHAGLPPYPPSTPQLMLSRASTPFTGMGNGTLVAGNSSVGHGSTANLVLPVPASSPNQLVSKAAEAGLLSIPQAAARQTQSSDQAGPSGEIVLQHVQHVVPPSPDDDDAYTEAPPSYYSAHPHEAVQTAHPFL